MLRSVLPEHDAAKALAHPLRAAILERLYDRERSPVQLAKELDAPLANVSHHVRVLHDLGAIALVRRRQVRGAFEHFFTATVKMTLNQEPL